MLQCQSRFRAIAGAIIIAAIAALGPSCSSVERSRASTAPNLLILSACSFSLGHLKPYGYPVDTTPNLTRFSDDALVFTNYVVHKSWANFNQALREVWRRPAETASYSAYVHDLFQDVYLPEKVSILKPRYETSYDAPDWTKLELLRQMEPKKARILERERFPFFSMVHLKSAHYPFMGANAAEIDYDKFLSPRSLELARRYAGLRGSRASANYAKAPVIALLFSDLDFVERAIKSRLRSMGRKSAPKLTDPDGILGNEFFINAWKTSAGFEDDLRMLHELHDAKLNYADAMFEGLLTGYNDPEVQGHTVTVFVGDHGTALMEHGYLHNGTAPYDEQIRVPLVIKFPGLKGRHTIDLQFSEESLAAFLTDIASGRVTAANAEQAARRYEALAILSRDCANSFLSLRFKNQWKYIRNVASGKSELYDLVADARELNNVIESHPDIAGKLGEQMIRRQDEVEKLTQERCPDNNVPRKFR